MAKEYDLAQMCDKGQGKVNYDPSTGLCIDSCGTGFFTPRFVELSDPMTQEKGPLEISCEGCDEKPEGFSVTRQNQPYR
ncbi:hypothetical protein ISR94_02225 [Candidatus Microgenomates bacterium]|nr:hypothetical protein [Candidatus Microgenomates bacterium]